MARIRSIKESPGPLFLGVTVSGAMYGEVVARAAEGYNPLLKPLRPKDLLKVIAEYPRISLVKGRSLEVGVIIAEVNGKHVTFRMTLDLHGPHADVESCLQTVVERLLPDSGITVRNGALGGEIFLPEEPYRVPTVHNGAMYFLNSEKDSALSYLAQDLGTFR